MTPTHDDIVELRAEVRAESRYHQAYLRNPDCRDPDHPGCDACMDGEEDEE